MLNNLDQEEAQEPIRHLPSGKRQKSDGVPGDMTGDQETWGNASSSGLDDKKRRRHAAEVPQANMWDSEMSLTSGNQYAAHQAA